MGSEQARSRWPAPARAAWRALAPPRLRAARSRRRLERAHRGTAVICPCCGWEGARFAPFRERAGAACPRCGSLERHRALWRFLTRGGRLESEPRVLHFAPEPCLEGLWGGAASYVSVDLAGPATVQADITALPFPAASFDLVVCVHVLEHVPDDGTAMRELRRVTAPDGAVVVMVPRDPGRAVTYEDPGIIAPAARLAAFGQDDHVRIYGRDLVDRLEAAGFETTEEQSAEAEEIFLCRPRGRPLRGQTP